MDTKWLEVTQVAGDLVRDRVSGLPGIDERTIEYMRAIVGVAGGNPFLYKEVLDVNPPNAYPAMAMWSMGAVVASIHKDGYVSLTHRAEANWMCGDLPFSSPVGVYFAMHDAEEMFPFAPAYNERWGIVTCFDIESLRSPGKFLWDIYDMADAAIFFAKRESNLSDGDINPKDRRGWKTAFAEVDGGRVYYLRRKRRDRKVGA